MRLADFNRANNESTALDSIATKQVNWQSTRIGSTPGARETDPWAINLGMDSTAAMRNPRVMHKRLDQAMDASSSSYSPDRRKRLHDALDRWMAGEDSSFEEERQRAHEDAENFRDDDEEPEEDPDEEENMARLKDAVGSFTKRASAADRLSVAMDAAPETLLHRYVNPSERVPEGLRTLEKSLHLRQKDSSAISWWRGLQVYLSGMPRDSRMKDCNSATLIPLLRVLHRNRAD
jgi:hypothetical protein